MPWRSEWVDPELFLNYRGVSIHHTYKNDDIETGPSRYFFTTDAEATETDASVFDIRELPTWTEPPHPPFLSGADDTPANRKAWNAYARARADESHKRSVICAAIDRGLISADGRLQPESPPESSRPSSPGEPMQPARRPRRAATAVILREFGPIGRYRVRLIRTSDAPQASTFADIREFVKGSNYEGYTRKGIRLGEAEARALRAVLDEVIASFA